MPSFFSRIFTPQQHTRWVVQTQRLLTLCAVLLLALVWLGQAEAQEQVQYPGGYTLMPLDPGPVRLLSMTVDANIRDDGEQAIAEVQAVFRVHNQDKKNNRTLTVAIPGYPAPKPPPSQLSFTTGGDQIPMTPGHQQWWVADIKLKPNQRRNLILTYSTSLGSDPFVRFSYPMELTAQVWPDRLNSARVTLTFSDPPNPQSWLKLTPEDYKLTAESITWSYDTEDPKEPIEFILMRPSLWNRLHSARQASVATNTPASAHMALGDIYNELATTSADPDIFKRYFPLAVAAYSQAKNAAPEDPAPYLLLSKLYRTRAELDQPPDSTYVSLAVNELANALEHGVRDPAIIENVSQNFAALVARARLQGDFDTANSYLHRLDELADASQVSLESDTLSEERRRLAIDWVTTVLQDQGPGPARAVLEEHFGQESSLPATARFARLNSLHVATETEFGKRIITIEAAPRAEGEALVQTLYDALADTGVAEVDLYDIQPLIIRIDLPFEDADHLLDKQQTLAAAIPPEPEWTLLSSILLPQTLTWTRTDEGWRTLENYEEHVSLIAAVADLGIEALSLDQAASALDTKNPLDTLRAQLWQAEAEVWRRLAGNSSARFALTLDPVPGPPVTQNWFLDPGEQVAMTGSTTRFHVMPYVLMGVTVYLAFIAISYGLWRWNGREKGR